MWNGRGWYIAWRSMKPALFPSLLLVVALLAAVALPGCSRQPAGVAKKELPEGARALLERYEKVRAALAADKYADARFQAGELASEAKVAARDGIPGVDTAVVQNLAEKATTMSGKTNITQLRAEFKPTSQAAIQLAAGSPSYYVLNCPMTKDGDWLQTDTKVSNPYFGKSMLECGVVKK